MKKISFEERARVLEEQIIPAKNRMWKNAIDLAKDPFQGLGGVTKTRSAVDHDVQTLVSLETNIKDLISHILNDKTLDVIGRKIPGKMIYSMMPRVFAQTVVGYLKLTSEICKGLLMYKEIETEQQAKIFKNIHDLCDDKLTSKIKLENYFISVCEPTKTFAQKGLDSGAHFDSLWKNLPDKDPTNQNETLIIDNVRIHFAVYLAPDDKNDLIKNIKHAFDAIKQSKVPHYSKVLYGDLFVVNTNIEAAAYYEPRTDMVWLNTSQRKSRGGEHFAWSLVHEYGHRFYGKVLEAHDKKNWIDFYRNINSITKAREHLTKSPKPKVGDSLWNTFGLITKVKVKNKLEFSIPGNDLITQDLGNGMYVFEFQEGIKEQISFATLFSIGYAPSRYSMTDCEEFFCECLAGYTLNKLRPNIKEVISEGFENSFLVPYGVLAQTTLPVSTQLPSNLKSVSRSVLDILLSTCNTLLHNPKWTKHVTQSQNDKIQAIYDKYKDIKDSNPTIDMDDKTFIDEVSDIVLEQVNLEEIAEEQAAAEAALAAEREQAEKERQEKEKEEAEKAKAQEVEKHNQNKGHAPVSTDDMLNYAIAHGSDSQRSFVKSLAAQYGRNGYLSEKQIAVLKKIYAEIKAMKGEVGIDKHGLSPENEVLLDKLLLLEEIASAQGNDFAQKFAKSLAVELSSRKTLNLSPSQANVLKKLFSQFGVK